MLQPRNLSALLSQCLSQSPHSDSNPAIISSILSTNSGRPITSVHIPSRLPPPPHTEYDQLSLSEESPGDTSQDRPTTLHIPPKDSEWATSPFHVDRALKTKIYSLFASSVWNEYSKANFGPLNQDIQGNNEDRSELKWISLLADTFLILVAPVFIQNSSQLLLLILVADESFPSGQMVNKALQTVKVLEGGLQGFKIYD